ncbi:MAG: hypothetical protein H0U57_06205 [Tatlockia sp.]|nr:hypothetical protein [Tatlockia sp.]
MMHKLIVLFLLGTTLMGCAPAYQGSFSQAPLALNGSIATDSVNRMVSLYPPAHSHFQIKVGRQESFNLELIKSLRQKGYSVTETLNEGRPGLLISGFIDELTKGHLYRVNLLIGTTTFARAYKVKNGVIIPLGFWVRKE